VFIFDMNWHQKASLWGGYTWDANLFPVPEQVLDYLQSENLLSGANLHDNSGVIREEAEYEAMRAAIGWKSQSNIPFASCSNQTFAFALEDIIVSPLGFDVPWIDWQQGGDKGGCSGETQNPTIWLNRLRATANLRTGKSNQRGMALGRWGGLGNHRYPSGFSGDVLVVSWKDLAFQVFFSITASNVQFAWSHVSKCGCQCLVLSDLAERTFWVHMATQTVTTSCKCDGFSGVRFLPCFELTTVGWPKVFALTLTIVQTLKCLICLASITSLLGRR
jgi:hypothetical protein